MARSRNAFRSWRYLYCGDTYPFLPSSVRYHRPFSLISHPAFTGPIVANLNDLSKSLNSRMFWIVAFLKFGGWNDLRHPTYSNPYDQELRCGYWTGSLKSRCDELTLEIEAGKSDVNASVAKKNADQARTLAEQLSAEAEAIEANVKKGEAEEAVRHQSDEYQKLSCQEKYEDERASKKEKDGALQMVAEKRGLAEQHNKEVSEKEHVAQSLRGLAANSREFADKIRAL